MVMVKDSWPNTPTAQTKPTNKTGPSPSLMVQVDTAVTGYCKNVNVIFGSHGLHKVWSLRPLDLDLMSFSATHLHVHDV